VIKDRDGEIETLKKNYKYTRINELETDLKVYIEELMRMKNILTDVMKSNDPLEDPQKAKEIESQIEAQKNKIENARRENKEL
jgi:hypothetical protein